MPVHCSSSSCSNTCHTHDSEAATHSKAPLSSWEVVANKIMRVLEVLSLLALSAYSCYLLPELFIPFAGGAFLLGLCCQYIALKMKKSYINSGCQESGGCSQDLMKQLTGVRLPAPLGLAANFVMTACHIEHHREFLVPIIGAHFGFSIGAWIIELGYRFADRIKKSAPALQLA